MSLPADLAALAPLLGVAIYAVTGVPDLGAGIWDLLARGPRTERTRAAIQSSLGPVWEAHHTWLVFVVVVLFVAFPGAFYPFTVSLFWPLLLLAVGIMIRGTGFAFRTVGWKTGLWSRIHGIGGTLTMLVLGMAIGAISVDAITVSSGEVTSGALAGWVGPFALITGFFGLVLASHLAAIYLAADTKMDPEVASDFRDRALFTGKLLIAAALLTVVSSAWLAPHIFSSLLTPVGFLTVLMVSVLGVLTLRYLIREQVRAARWSAIGQTLFLIIGWGLAQYPRMIGPDVLIAASATPDNVLWYILGAVALGSIFLIPSLVFMYRVFKTDDQGELES